MKKALREKKPRNIRFLVSLGVIVLGLGFVFVSRCSSVSATCATQTSPQIPQTSQELNLRYWTYTPSALEMAHKQGKVVLYFWAPWCSTCASLDSELLKAQAQVPEGIIVLRVNYDQALELKQKYNVVTQHTFVQLDSDNNALSTWVGGELENFDKHLK